MKFSIRLATTIYVTSLLAPSASANTGCNLDNETCLTSKMKNIIQNEYQILKSGDLVQRNIQPTTLVSGQWRTSQEYYDELVSRHENIQRGGFSLNFLKLEIGPLECNEGPSSDIYECIATSNTDLKYVPLPESSNDMFDTKEVTPHKFSFTDNDQDGKWTITEHVPVTIDNMVETHLDQFPGDDTDNSAEMESAYIYGEADKIAKQNAPRLDIQQITDIHGSSPEYRSYDLSAAPEMEQAGVYNRSAAVAYALQWVDNGQTLRNPDYPSFNNDCTNYTSQVLEAGGWVHNSGWYQSNEAWWYNWLTQSYTWAGAENFWQHAYLSSRAQLETSFCNLNLGDLISADWDGDFLVNHTMVVSHKSGCEVFVSYHSTDRENKNIRELPQDANYWGWKITGTTF